MTGRDAALHMAAMRGRREACAMLVKRGADPMLADDSGRIAADMTDDAELATWLRYECYSLACVATAPAGLHSR